MSAQVTYDIASNGEAPLPHRVAETGAWADAWMLGHRRPCLSLEQGGVAGEFNSALGAVRAKTEAA